MRIILFLVIICGLNQISISQRDWKISAKPAVVTKSANPGFYEVAVNLNWSQVVSDCIAPNEVTVGTWLSYKPKKSEVTLTLRTGGKWGDNVVDAVIYMGEIVDSKGDKILKEVGCVRAIEGQTETVLSFNNLTPKGQYYILISGKNIEPNDRYNMHLSEEYTDQVNKPANIEENVTKKEQPRVIGRVIDASNNPKPGILVSLLNQRLQPIETSASHADGSFKFERLPKDEPFLARIDEDDNALALEMVLVGADGKIESRARKIGTKLYSFESIDNGMDDLVLLSEKDWKLNVNKGTIGVAGRLVDSESYLHGKANIEIGLYNSSEIRTNSTKTDSYGNFRFTDVKKGDYLIKIDDDDQETFSEIVLVDDLNVPYEFSNSDLKNEAGMFEFKPLPADIVNMKRMEVTDAQLAVSTDFSGMEEGESIVLNRILFESGSAQLLESSYTELDELAEALSISTNISIEISGHTDNQGSAESNKILSLGRAEAVKQYLETKGVSPKRLKAVGVGEESPIATNDTAEGRKQNRRVSIQKLD